jgi:hypothetical protein
LGTERPLCFNAQKQQTMRATHDSVTDFNLMRWVIFFLLVACNEILFLIKRVQHCKKLVMREVEKVRKEKPFKNHSRVIRDFLFLERFGFGNNISLWS